MYRYLENLLEYLSAYLSRVQPLTDHDTIVLEVRKDFEEKWQQGTFPGWRVSTSLCLVLTKNTCSLYIRINIFLKMKVYHLSLTLQKDTGSAMAKHSGAQLDLSAFSSHEVYGAFYQTVYI